MARPQKFGLDYFALDVNMNDEVELIEAEHGIEGFAILIKMFQKIYSEGYFYPWDEKNKLLFSNRVSVDRNKVTTVVNDCIRWGIFSSEMYKKYNILTSRRIQEHYISAVYKRVKVEMIKDYLLVDASNKNNVTLLGVSDNGNEDVIKESDSGNEDVTNISDVQSTQSKSKSKSNIYIKYNCFFETYNDQRIIIHKELTPKMKQAIDKALGKYSEDDILEAIRRYGEAFNDPAYQFCKYKMTLDKFLTQNNGFYDWLDEGQKWINYSDFKSKGPNQQVFVQQKTVQNQVPKKKTGFHLAHSRGDRYTADELEALVLNKSRAKIEGKAGVGDGCING